MENISFGGIISQKNGVLLNFEDLFEVEYDDSGRLIAASKDTFSHEEEDFNFNYKYVVEIADTETYNEEEDNIYASLYLVPTPQSLASEIAQDILDSSGLTEIEDIEYFDLLWDGCIGVQLGTESWSTEEGIDPLNDEKCKRVLDSIATLFRGIDGMRGFYLDRVYNRIGTSGWDILFHAVLGKKLF